jgi:Methylamine utilisation protein MauE
MQNITNQAFILMIVCWSLAFYLLPSAVRKLMHHDSFTQGVATYQILPHILERLVGLCIPWIELVMAAALLAEYALPLISSLLILLLLCFTTAVVINLFRKRVINCSCFAPLGVNAISWGIVARNGLLIMLATSILLIHQTLPSSQWAVLWATNAHVFSSPVNIVLLPLLLMATLIIILSIEWTVDSYHQIAMVQHHIQK